MRILKTISNYYKRDETWIHDFYYPINRRAYYLTIDNEGIHIQTWLNMSSISEWITSLRNTDTPIPEGYLETYTQNQE